ncbi:acyl-CoA dehydrogenase family protein [Streptomyces coelicoflavus]|uniref:acyl-CoA dehydrogenase family protein n=1 Tax=Streptomyces coelicoflavus TaxID=285562 RepID=UPI003812026A
MTVRAEQDGAVGELLTVLDDIYPLLQREAADSERLRRPTPAVQEALRASGVFGLMAPAALGGMEATPLQIMRVMEKLSHADASLGWLVRAVASETATAATYLGDEAVAALFAEGTFPLVAGQSNAFTGRAVRVGSGYRVNGTWQFAPGVSMATHLNLAVTVEGTGQRLVCLVPRPALRISDNWDMLGLRATSSLDYRAEELLVDDRYVFAVGPRSPRGRAANGPRFCRQMSRPHQE